MTDIYGNVMTSSSLPSTNIADGSALDVDGAPPTVLFRRRLITILLIPSHLRAPILIRLMVDLVVQILRPSWTGQSSPGISMVIAQRRVRLFLLTSTVVTSATQLTITLATSGIAKLELQVRVLQVLLRVVKVIRIRMLITLILLLVSLRMTQVTQQPLMQLLTLHLVMLTRLRQRFLATSLLRTEARV